MILIKAVAKHVQDFLSRISKPGRLAYVSVSLYISSSCRQNYDIVPIERLRKGQLPKDTQQTLYLHKRLKDNKAHKQQAGGMRNKIKKKEKQEVQNLLPLKYEEITATQKWMLLYEKHSYYTLI